VRAIRHLLKPLHPIADCPNRRLHFDEYVCYVLLHLFNPELDSLRVLQWKSREQTFQRHFGLPPFSLGSFSEAGAAFPAAPLPPILQQVFDHLDPRPSHRELLQLKKGVVAFDGSLLSGPATMDWAQWRPGERAAKMHTFYDVSRGAPRIAYLTDANTDERQVLREHLDEKLIYLVDRGLRDYSLFNDILQQNSSFVARTPINLSYEVRGTRPVSPEAEEAGVLKDQIIRLTSEQCPALKERELRLIQIHVPRSPTIGPSHKHVSRKCTSIRVPASDPTLVLLTDLLDLDVLLMALLYRCRWQIETFFCWYKLILNADHLLSQRYNGLQILIWCALLATLLLTHWAGARPSKYRLRLLCANLMGTLTDRELEDQLRSMAEREKNS